MDTTSHSGILINKMQDIDLVDFNLILEKLLKYSLDENVEKVTETIFEIVPDKFRNS